MTSFLFATDTGHESLGLVTALTETRAIIRTPSSRRGELVFQIFIRIQRTCSTTRQAACHPMQAKLYVARSEQARHKKLAADKQAEMEAAEQRWAERERQDEQQLNAVLSDKVATWAPRLLIIIKTLLFS